MVRKGRGCGWNIAKIFFYAVMPSALDRASQSSHNELPADLSVLDSLQNKTIKDVFVK